jgi:hypothetical protein
MTLAGCSSGPVLAAGLGPCIAVLPSGGQLLCRKTAFKNSGSKASSKLRKLCWHKVACDAIRATASIARSWRFDCDSTEQWLDSP